MTLTTDLGLSIRVSMFEHVDWWLAPLPRSSGMGEGGDWWSWPMGVIAKGNLRGCQGLFTPLSLGYQLWVFNKKLYSQRKKEERKRWHSGRRKSCLSGGWCSIFCVQSFVTQTQKHTSRGTAWCCLSTHPDAHRHTHTWRYVHTSTHNIMLSTIDIKTFSLT